MATAGEEVEDPEPVMWTEVMDTGELAFVQQRLEADHGIDMEDEAGKKGASRKIGRTFYTDLETEVQVGDAELTITLEGEDEVEMGYFSDDVEMLSSFQDYLENTLEEFRGDGVEGDEMMLEPYKFRDLDGAELLYVTRSLRQEERVEGPESRPAKGQVREYPIRVENLDMDEEDSYIMQGDTVVGDGRYQVKDLEFRGTQGPVTGAEGQISVRPVKNEDGLYNLKVRSQDEDALGYLVNLVRRFRSEAPEQVDSDYMLDGTA